jgi:RNA polymerase sigma-70 factor (ECF subfamily)
LETPLDAAREQALIAETRTNPDAFRPLYRHYFPRVYAYVAYRVGSQADAEDIVADVFLQVVRSLGRFEYRGEGAFSAWVFRIAHHRLARHYAHARRAAHISLDTLPDGGENLPDGSIHDDQDDTTLVRTLIAALSPRRQEVILLRYAGGLNNREIAVVLGLDERTVASHLSRAIDDMQRQVHEEPTE